MDMIQSLKAVVERVRNDLRFEESLLSLSWYTSAELKALEDELKDRPESAFARVSWWLQKSKEEFSQLDPISVPIQEFRSDISGGNYNANAKDFFIVTSATVTPTVFDAVSIHLTGHENLALALQFLTTVETLLQHRKDSFCETTESACRESESSRNWNNSFPSPEDIASLSRIISKRIILHIGNSSLVKSSYSFGNQAASQELHILEAYLRFLPLKPFFPNASLTYYSTPVQWRALHNKNSADLEEKGIKILEYAQCIFKSKCDFCSSFGFFYCHHFFETHRRAAQNLLDAIKNGRFISPTRSMISNHLIDKSCKLPNSIRNEFSAVKVKGDGDCFYHAVGYLLTGNLETGALLRRIVAMDFTENREIYHKCFMSMKYSEKDFRHVQDNVNSYTAWAISESLLLLSKVLDVNFIVFNPGCGYGNSYTIFQEGNREKLYLFNDTKHYWPLIKNHTEINIQLSPNIYFAKFAQEYAKSAYENDNFNLITVTEYMNNTCDNNSPVAASSKTTSDTMFYDCQTQNDEKPVAQCLNETSNEVSLVEDPCNTNNIPATNAENNLQLNKVISEMFQDSFKPISLFASIIREEIKSMQSFGLNLENVSRFAEFILEVNKFWRRRVKFKNRQCEKATSALAKRMHYFLNSENGRKAVVTVLMQEGIASEFCDYFSLVAKEIGEKKNKTKKHTNASASINTELPTLPNYSYVTSDAPPVSDTTAVRNETALSPDAVDDNNGFHNIQCDQAQHNEEEYSKRDLRRDAKSKPPSEYGGNETDDDDNSTNYKEGNQTDDGRPGDEEGDPNKGDTKPSESHTDNGDVAVEEIKQFALGLGFTSKDFEYVPEMNFTFTLADSVMRDIFDFKKGRFISGKWVEAINIGIQTKNLCCSFRAVRAPEYRTRLNLEWCKMEGHCLCGLHFFVFAKLKPKSNEECVFRVKSEGDFQLIQVNATGRQVSGNRRAEMKKMLTHEMAGKVFVEGMSTASNYRLLHNNHPQMSLSVLQVIRHEAAHSDEKDKDWAEDIRSFESEIQAKDDKSKTVAGFIHKPVLNKNSLQIHMYTEQAITLLSTCNKFGVLIAFFDATGSLFTTKFTKYPLLYSIMIKTSNGVVFPLASMLSQRGRESEINNFMLSVFTDYKDVVRRKVRMFDIICIDFSFASIHALLRALNCMTLSTYLQMCYLVLRGKQIFSSQHTVIFLCTAHITKSFSTLLRKHFTSATLKNDQKTLALNSLSRLQQCSTLEEFLKSSEVICKLFCQKCLPSDLSKSLSEYIINKSDMIDMETIQDIPLEELENLELGSKTLRDNSPFYRLIVVIRQTVVDTPVAGDPNPFYNPKVMDLLQNYYIPYICLFSAMMLKASNVGYGRSRLSNSYVEAEFGVLKKIYMNCTKLPINIFLRQFYGFYVGELKKTIYVVGEKYKKKQTRKRRGQSPLPEESWGKRQARKGTKYYKNNNDDEHTTDSKCSKNTKTMDFDLGDLSQRVDNDLKDYLAGHKPTKVNFKFQKAGDFNDHLMSENPNENEHLHRYLQSLILKHGEQGRVLEESLGGLLIKEPLSLLQSLLVVDHNVANQILQHNYINRYYLQESRRVPDELLPIGYNSDIGTIATAVSHNANDITLRTSSIAELCSTFGWLSSDVIQAYILLQVQKHPASIYEVTLPRYLYFISNGILESSIVNEGRVCDIITGKNLTDFDYILHPLLIINHWILLRINKVSKVCTIFDTNRSLKTFMETETFKTNLRWNILPKFFPTGTDLSQWYVRYQENLCHQEDGSSCGVYVSCLIKYFTETDDLGFNGCHVNVMLPKAERIKIARELLTTTTYGENILLNSKDGEELERVVRNNYVVCYVEWVNARNKKQEKVVKM